MRRAALVLLGACGAAAPDAPPDAAPDAHAPPPDPWTQPIAIDALPFRADGDLATAPARATTYDCELAAPGGEAVFALTLAAPTTLRLGVDGADLVVVSGPPDDAGAVAGCAAHVTLALETELPAGAWYVVADGAGPFALSVVRAEPGACLENPLPACDETTTPDPNVGVVEPPGQGGCPPGMTAIGGAFCIDRWEAALAGHSPYATPGASPPPAFSAPGAVPQGYISQTQAAAACAAAGKRLCSDAEWLRACQGEAGRTFPYGDARVDGACNDARACHPAVQYFESTDGSVYSMLGHPCLGQLPDGLAPTGAHVACATDEGVHDLMGNLHEWTADPAGTFRGGFFVDTRINGDGCLYRTTAHDVAHRDYSTGFRCCADLQ